MTKTEHTPGPWWYRDYGAPAETRFVITQAGGGVWFASAQNEEDARLIAKAPEMAELIDKIGVETWREPEAARDIVLNIRSLIESFRHDKP